MSTVDGRAGSPWRVPFVRPDLPSADELAPVFRRIIASGTLTKGSELVSLETEAARLIGVSHVVAVSSCAVGLALVMRSLRAVAEGSQPSRSPADDRREVIVPSFIFLAAPAAIEWAGLEPVFVEVDPGSWTIDAAAVASAIGPRTLAVLGCHTFGCPVDTEAVEGVCAAAGVPLLIDAAHGLGSLHRGRPVGAQGYAQVFSMSPTKLVCAGEGGLVATDSQPLADSLRQLREYGNDGHYDCVVPGLNGRLPELAAALGRASLERLPEVATRRAAAAAAYTRVLSGVPGISRQVIDAADRSSWKDYSIRLDPVAFGIDRDDLRRRLAAAGIDTRAYYDPPCHRMPAFRHYRRATSLHATDQLSAESLSLPLGAHVDVDLATEIASLIVGTHEQASRARSAARTAGE